MDRILTTVICTLGLHDTSVLLDLLDLEDTYHCGNVSVFVRTGRAADIKPVVSLIRLGRPSCPTQIPFSVNFIDKNLILHRKIYFLTELCGVLRSARCSAPSDLVCHMVGTTFQCILWQPASKREA
jgi:hypothetical protein